jgi:hypothetical protein
MPLKDQIKNYARKLTEAKPDPNALSRMLREAKPLVGVGEHRSAVLRAAFALSHRNRTVARAGRNRSTRYGRCRDPCRNCHTRRASTRSAGKSMYVQFPGLIYPSHPEPGI